ncbi:MAG: alanine racemase [Oscillospiraceae bacterium]|nr:alanine racemase [Oscillospiraceae bacterium]
MSLLILKCDLGALSFNAQHIKELTQTPLIAVLKSEAYGAGAPECARALEGEALAFAVAEAREAEALRRAGIKSDIMILGCSGEEELSASCEGIIPAIDRAELIKELYRRNPFARLQLRLDLDGSGLGLDERGFIRALEELEERPTLELWGVFAHCPSIYSGGDCEALARRFDRLCELARPLNPALIRHIATSAALSKECLYFDALRLGTALMGLPSSEGQAMEPLRPVLSLSSRLVRVFQSKSELAFYDGYVDFGRISLAGVVAAGYGELPALLGRKNVRAAVRGRTVPLVGRASMSHMIVDLSAVPDAAQGDEVVFVGKSGESQMSAASFAASCGVSVCRVEGALMCTPSARRKYLHEEERGR